MHEYESISPQIEQLTFFRQEDVSCFLALVNRWLPSAGKQYEANTDKKTEDPDDLHGGKVFHDIQKVGNAEDPQVGELMHQHRDIPVEWAKDEADGGIQCDKNDERMV